jgi:hypothetical protein
MKSKILRAVESRRHSRLVLRLGVAPAGVGQRGHHLQPGPLPLHGLVECIREGRAPGCIARNSDLRELPLGLDLKLDQAGLALKLIEEGTLSTRTFLHPTTRITLYPAPGSELLL